MLKTIQICGVIISILIFTIILFKHKKDRYQKVLFLLFILSLTYYSFIVLLIKNGLILEYPHLWNTATPVNFLHLAIFMIFVRSIVKDLQAPEKIDFLLICLPILSLLAIAPFYFKSIDYKINRIRYILENEDSIFYIDQGFISGYHNYLAQFTVGIVFGLIAIYLLIKSLRKKEKATNKSEFIWLICVSILLFLGNLIGLTSLIFDSASLDTHSLDSYLFAIYIIIIFLYPFFEPKILYGTLLDVKKKNTVTTEKKQEFSENDLAVYHKQIEDFFTIESSYLKPNFRQEDLSNFLEISKKDVSQIITCLYNKNFNQFINEKRINMVLTKFENSDWLNYSLEGVALEVGFKSRTTFIKAFKEKTSITPSEYKKNNTPKIL